MRTSTPRSKPAVRADDRGPGFAASIVLADDRGPGNVRY